MQIEIIVFLPSNLEYPQQPHGTENTETERTVGIKHRPDDFEQTAADYLRTRRQSIISVTRSISSYFSLQ